MSTDEPDDRVDALRYAFESLLDASTDTSNTTDLVSPFDWYSLPIRWGADQAYPPTSGPRFGGNSHDRRKARRAWRRQLLAPVDVLGIAQRETAAAIAKGYDDAFISAASADPSDPTSTIPKKAYGGPTT